MAFDDRPDKGPVAQDPLGLFRLPGFPPPQGFQPQLTADVPGVDCKTVTGGERNTPFSHDAQPAFLVYSLSQSALTRVMIFWISGSFSGAQTPSSGSPWLTETPGLK